MLVKDEYKLVYYTGYAELNGENEKSLLFNIRADPEELNELSNSQKNITSELTNILKTKLNDINKPYINQ